MKRGLLLLIFVLFIVPLASAATFQLTVHTLPIHEVSIFILDPGDKYKSLKSFPPMRTGFDGLVIVNTNNQ